MRVSGRMDGFGREAGESEVVVGASTENQEVRRTWGVAERGYVTVRADSYQHLERGGGCSAEGGKGYAGWWQKWHVMEMVVDDCGGCLLWVEAGWVKVWA